jgi:mannosyl-3-phosphoglycerate phosphatase
MAFDRADIPLVVFSDLDGTLLDRQTYKADGAREALDLLARERIPLVFCSSKTRAEIQLFQQILDVNHPFICENGGALYIPDAYFAFELFEARRIPGYSVVEYGRPYAEVVDVLHHAALKLAINVVGFSDMSVLDVARECQLPLLQARLAKLREYDEPFRILNSSPTARARLSRALNAARLGWIDGGRFEHAGALVDKGVAAKRLTALYERAAGPCLTVGLGDAPNDVSLLSQVDLPVVVRNDDDKANRELIAKVPTALLTEATGPAGWAEAIVAIVEDVGRGRLTAPALASRSRRGVR